MVPRLKKTDKKRVWCIVEQKYEEIYANARKQKLSNIHVFGVVLRFMIVMLFVLAYEMTQWWEKNQTYDEVYTAVTEIEDEVEYVYDNLDVNSDWEYVDKQLDDANNLLYVELLEQ